MALKDLINNLRDYFVEEEDTFDEPVRRPVQESKATVVTPKPQAEAPRPKPFVAEQRQVSTPKPKPQPKTAATMRSVPNFSKPMPENIIQQSTQAPSYAAALTIAIKEPRAYADLMEAARIVKNGESVLINFKFMNDSQARRSIDFMTGVAFTLDGDIQNIGGQIFLATPANITIDAAKEMSMLAGQNFENYDVY